MPQADPTHSTDSIEPQMAIEPGYFLVISDTHIGRERTNRSKDTLFHKQEIQEVFNAARQRAKHLVLNGDIFGIVRKYRSANKQRQSEIYARAIKDARVQLTEWVKEAEEAGQHVYFVLGNHENTPEFREILDELQQNHTDTFCWHEEAILLGDTLFVHGDLPDRGLTDKTRPYYNDKTGLKFKKFARDPETSSKKLHQFLCEKAEIGTELQAEGKEDSDKIMHMLDVQEGEKKIFTEDVWDQVKHVISGHTHRKYMHETKKGRAYHNAGAPLKGYDDKAKKLGFIVGHIDHNGETSKLVNYEDFLKSEKTFQERLRILSTRSIYSEEGRAK